MLDLYLTLLLFSVSGGLIGTYLHHQKSLMAADGMSHSLLLGIILFTLIQPDFNPLYTFPFLLIFSIIITLIYDRLNKSQLFQKDASLLFVTITLYALAILIISRYAQNSHLDFDRIFLGQMLFVSFNQISIGTYQIPSSIFWGIMLLGTTLAFYLVYYKQILHYLFDPNHYTLHQSRYNVMKYLFLIQFNCFFIASFESLGVPLTLTLLSGPALVGQLFSQRFIQSLFITSLFAVSVSSLGLHSALKFNLNISGTICAFCLSFFLFFVLLKKRLKKKVPNT